MSHDSVPPEDASQLAAHLTPTLALLRAVAAEGHLTRAAEILGVPQPTVSRALTRLGDQLSTPIVTRHGRGIRLTRTGQLLADAADAALRTLESECREVIEELDPQRGHVVLGFQHTMGSSLVPELLSGFRQRHPHVRFTLVQGSHDDLLARTLDGRVDLCLVSPLPGAEGWESAALLEEPLPAVLFSGHRLARRRRIRWPELVEDDFVVLRPGYGLRRIFTDLAARSDVQPRLAFEGEEVDTLRGLVAAGLGVSVLPAADAGPVPGTVEVPLEPPVHRTVGLAWTARSTPPPAVQAFRDFAVTQARPGTHSS